jgi:hypothetical protein
MLKRERTMEDGAVANTLPSAETPMPTSRKSTPNAFTLSSGGPILPPFAAAARCNARALPDGREDKAGSKPDRLSNIIHGFNSRWPERPVSAGLGLDGAHYRKNDYSATISIKLYLSASLRLKCRSSRGVS